MSVDHPSESRIRPVNDRVLIVEDEPDVAEAIADLLAHCGREVTICHDMESAELMVDHLQPDRVICDVRLTGAFRFEGLEFLDHLSELPRPCTTVLISGAMTPELKAEAERRGATAVLQKPFEVAELERLIGAPPAHGDACHDDGTVIRVPFLDDIIFSDRLVPDFQPIVRIDGEGMFGFESLARFATESLLGEPEILFAYAAQKGRVVELERACMARSFEMGAPLVPFGLMFLNLHPAVLNEGERFSEFLREEAHRWQLPLDRVVLELTEQAQVRIDQRFFAAVERIRSCGVRFAFDDVGVAYSHLPLIDRVRPSFLKVSQDFGTDFESDPTRSKLVRNLLALSNEFEIPLILEGIESTTTVQAARDLGITLGQGFHYKFPSPAEHLLQWAREHPDTASAEDEVVIASIDEYLVSPVADTEAPETSWVAFSGGDSDPAPEATQPPSPLAYQPREKRGDISEDFFQALKQIYDLGEIESVEPQAVDRFLQNVLPAVLELCPSENREELSARIASLKPREKFFMTSAGDVPLPALPSTEVPSRDVTPPASKNERRFALIIGQLSKRTGTRSPSQASEFETLAQLIVLAAEMATTEGELKDSIRQIPLGAEGVENMFQVLSHGMASWDLAVDTPGEPHEVLRAMQKIFSLSTDPNVRAKRFRDLIMAAVERLINGAFSTAVSMFELAESLVGELALHSTVTDRIRSDALKAVQAGKLDRFAKDTQRHPVLRKALRFFPDLSPEMLIDRLRDERSPEGRDEILAILEVWGAEARQTALDRIDREIDSDVAGGSVLLQNLFALLEIIPRDPERDIRHELDVLSRASAPGRPTTVVIRALTAIGEIKREAAVRLLKQRLAEFVAIPFRSDREFYEPEELSRLLDATVAALAKTEAPAALRAIAQHGLRQESVLGNTRARLRHLSQVDLLLDIETLSMMVKAIRAELPGKILGRVVMTRQGMNPTPLIEALRETRGETVRLLLKEIVAEYPQTGFGEAAASVLKERARRAKQVATPERMEGKLLIYGLPRLIQSYVDSTASGTLSLVDENREIRGRLFFQEGRLIDVAAGKLRDADALFQLIERPVVGSFAFVSRAKSVSPSTRPPLDLPALLAEGMRRRDELQPLLALAPDDAVFRATGSRPTRHPQENDPQFLREVWVRTSSGEPLQSWEPEVLADSWRIRRIVARWVEGGSLQQITEPSN